MGELIPLRPRQEARTPGKASLDRGDLPVEGAAILLFTGVRYERHEEGPSSPAKRPAGRGGRRKRA